MTALATVTVLAFLAVAYVVVETLAWLKQIERQVADVEERVDRIERAVERRKAGA